MSLFEFLAKLDAQSVSYTIHRTRPDTVRVDVTFVGLRVEVDFFEDGHIEYSTFSGTEDVYDDVGHLLRIIEANR